MDDTFIFCPYIFLLNESLHGWTCYLYRNMIKNRHHAVVMLADRDKVEENTTRNSHVNILFCVVATMKM